MMPQITNHCMEEKSIPKNKLLDRCCQAMREYGMSESTVRRYMTFYRHLHSYMESTADESYTEVVGEKFLNWFLSNSSNSDDQKHLAIRVVSLLKLILHEKPYEARYTHIHKEYQFRGNVGKAAQSFLQSLAERHLRPSTISQRKFYLSYFSIAMTNKGITLEDISQDDIINYICTQQTSREQVIITLRLFFRYLYEHHLIDKNLADNIKNIKARKNEKIVSFYSAEEISKIENTLERKTRNGKRNYAMVLLATRLGLRASDVTGLRFGEIDWEKCTITRKQHKTGRTITLPLLSDVGDAIIDYILNARPETNGIDSIFVSSIRPYRPCSSTSFTCVVKRAIVKSGVSIDGRHHGAHCLRHSLATTLMNGGTEFPVISEVLGHGSTESTTFYLGVSIKNLLECSLDVPLVRKGFYTQKGGEFYE